MGFDIYGMNPQTDKPEPPQPSMKGGEWTKKEKEQWKKYEEWRDESGGYFRNNVWWWRPLWHFVCGVCDDILTEEDRNAGEFNDGHHITDKKAKAISKRLFKMLDNGEVKKYEEGYREYIESLEEGSWNKSYPFDIDNVRAFATFCSKCGGFEIC
tara:strand:- start:7775 stop:8239 length:465 start_codon:yes stop_codon:yes gene_type:complete